MSDRKPPIGTMNFDPVDLQLS